MKTEARPDTWIVVQRWEEFQHRDAARQNVPTWIKTFTRLLSDDAYLTLTGHQRGVLHGIWLEYARSLRELPGTTLSLSRRLSLKVTEKDLKALNHAGFIAIVAGVPAGIVAGGVAGAEERREEKELTRAVPVTRPHANGFGRIPEDAGPPETDTARDYLTNPNILRSLP